jgi:hypothetical protein
MVSLPLAYVELSINYLEPNLKSTLKAFVEIHGIVKKWGADNFK